jgi:hypothetical protein
MQVENIYLAPAFLASIAAVFGTVLFFKTLAGMLVSVAPVKSETSQTEAERKKEAA